MLSMNVGLCKSLLANGTLEKNVSTRWKRTGGGGMLSGQTVVDISNAPGLPGTNGARGSNSWSGIKGGWRLSHGEGGSKKLEIGGAAENRSAVDVLSPNVPGGFGGLEIEGGLAAELESLSLGYVVLASDGDEKSFRECAAPQVHFAKASLVA